MASEFPRDGEAWTYPEQESFPVWPNATTHEGSCEGGLRVVASRGRRRNHRPAE